MASYFSISKCADFWLYGFETHIASFRNVTFTVVSRPVRVLDQVCSESSGSQRSCSWPGRALKSRIIIHPRELVVTMMPSLLRWRKSPEVSSKTRAHCYWQGRLTQPLTCSLSVLAGSAPGPWLWEVMLCMKPFYLFIFEILTQIKLLLCAGHCFGTGHLVVNKTGEVKAPPFRWFISFPQKYELDSQEWVPELWGKHLKKESVDR